MPTPSKPRSKRRDDIRPARHPCDNAGRPFPRGSWRPGKKSWTRLIDINVRGSLRHDAGSAEANE